MLSRQPDCTCCVLPITVSTKINDNLIGAFIHLIAQYEKQAKLAADGAVQKAMTEASAHTNQGQVNATCTC